MPKFEIGKRWIWHCSNKFDPNTSTDELMTKHCVFLVQVDFTIISFQLNCFQFLLLSFTFIYLVESLFLVLFHFQGTFQTGHLVLGQRVNVVILRHIWCVFPPAQPHTGNNCTSLVIITLNLLRMLKIRCSSAFSAFVVNINEQMLTFWGYYIQTNIFNFFFSFRNVFLLWQYDENEDHVVGTKI